MVSFAEVAEAVTEASDLKELELGTGFRIPKDNRKQKGPTLRPKIRGIPETKECQGGGRSLMLKWSFGPLERPYLKSAPWGESSASIAAGAFTLSLGFRVYEQGLPGKSVA